jgi:DNA-binding transcriptional regulator LsrR (DeoR family)
VVSKFAEVNVAIIGTGELEPPQLLKNSGNYYSEDMLKLLSERGTVGQRNATPFAVRWRRII